MKKISYDTTNEGRKNDEAVFEIFGYFSVIGIAKAERLIQKQEEAPITGSAWRLFKIHDDTTVEVVATVDCAGSRFQVPLLVNLATEEVHEMN